ncbi:ribonuclease H-like domain-containing protein [Tanacetum coccineum]
MQPAHHMTIPTHQSLTPAHPIAFGPTGPLQQAKFGGYGILQYAMSPSHLPQATLLPQAFQTLTFQQPNWNMDTGAMKEQQVFVSTTCFLTSAAMNVSTGKISDSTVTDLVSLKDEQIDSQQRMKDYQTRQLLLCCDSTGDLYPVTQQPSSNIIFALLSLSPTTWNRRLGHPSEDVLRRLESSRFISCNKTKLSALCHACQLGKHTRLPFYSYESNVASVFDIIHSDL